MAKKKEDPNKIKFSVLHSEVNFDDVKKFDDSLKSSNSLEQVSKDKSEKEIEKELIHDNFEYKTIVPNGVNEILSLLNEYICNVQFQKVSSPGIRTIKCTLNSRLMKKNTDGIGYINGIIKIVDLESGEWKSFYPETVKKITYTEKTSGIV